MSIYEIEQAITELPPHDLTRLREWFEDFDAKIWDEKFERDAKAGKLDKIAEKAVAEYRAGKSKEL
jgi:hypothetical protein